MKVDLAVEGCVSLITDFMCRFAVLMVWVDRSIASGDIYFYPGLLIFDLTFIIAQGSRSKAGDRFTGCAASRI